MKQIFHKTSIDISKKNREHLVGMLNDTLAGAADLYLQLKQAHWNIKGESFIGVHKLLDEIAEQVEGQVDVVAERATALGGTALGTLEMVKKNSILNKYPVNIFSIDDHIRHLAANIAILSKHVRKNIKLAEKYSDYGTSDMYIDFVRELDKNLWFLEAHLQD